MPLDIGREIAALRNQPGHNFTALAFQKMVSYVNGISSSGKASFSAR